MASSAWPGSWGSAGVLWLPGTPGSPPRLLLLPSLGRAEGRSWMCGWLGPEGAAVEGAELH